MIIRRFTGSKTTIYIYLFNHYYLILRHDNVVLFYYAISENYLTVHETLEIMECFLGLDFGFHRQTNTHTHTHSRTHAHTHSRGNTRGVTEYVGHTNSSSVGGGRQRILGGRQQCSQ